MIITCLIGGLGNQMFQYAVARNLAIKNKSEVVLDFNCLKEDEKRHYGLDLLNITAREAREKEIDVFYEREKSKRIWMKVRNLLKNSYVKKINEKEFSFQEEILNLKGNIYLKGYWQTEKYFQEIANLLKLDFKLKRRLIENEVGIKSKIKSARKSVAMHIRRGDYAENSKIREKHGLCELSYYEKAIDILYSKLGQGIRLFIFSDDIKWAKENLSVKEYIDYMEYIDYVSPDDGQGNLYLMSLCEHNIIANSTFSWWGAWLNSNPQKVVIAPKKWFKSDELDYSDIVPTRWIKL